MQHAVTTPTPPFAIAGGRLEVHQIPVLMDNLVWLIVDRSSGDAAVVDGPPDADPVLAACETLGVTLTTVLNTHTHWDHIGINQELAKRGLLDALQVYGPASRASEVPGLTHPVGEGDTFTLFGVDVAVWLTEGHIDGHVSFVLDGAVFCGDTMFAGGCGYLFDGPPAKMAHSLQRLCELPGTTRVCCAHEYTEDNLRFAWMVEPDNKALAARIREVWAIRADGGCTVPSTIEEERATNPFVRCGSPSLVRNVMALSDLDPGRKSHGPGSKASSPDSRFGPSGLPPQRDLSDYVTVFAATRALKDTKRHREIELELPL